MNILIPLAGKGSRFKEDSYDKPKPIIPIFGKEMILHIIDGLRLDAADTLIFVYNRELEMWGLPDIMKNRNVRFVRQDSAAIGAADTVARGLADLEPELLKRPTVLIDGDTIYHADILSKFRACATNAVFCFSDDGVSPIYSYLELCADGGNRIVSIREKERIGNLACTGGYCFKSGDVLLSYCRAIIANGIMSKGEFYTSCVIQQMLMDRHEFVAIELGKTDFHCVGTPLELRSYCGNRKNMTEPKRFCFDLDNTLVTAPTVPGDYSTVKPIDKNIRMLRSLKKLGNYIIIHTARRMRTHAGNVGAVMADVGAITFATLADFDIPYDELLFGKPYADFYIDDKAIAAQLDLERATGFYTNSVAERDFNELRDDKLDVIVKSSKQHKLQGEIHWYRNVPESVRHLFPAMVKSTSNSYTLERISGTTMSHLLVAGSLTTSILDRFLDNISSIHNSVKNIDVGALPLYDNYATKLKQRYAGYDYSPYTGADALYQQLLINLTRYEDDDRALPAVMHGDPVFSNCIVNASGMWFIDMRGMLGDTVTIYGDAMYDYAKIFQSLIGYDEILQDRYVNVDYRNTLINHFLKRMTTVFGADYVGYLHTLTASLLFTLIPLHYGKKCDAYFALAQQVLGQKSPSA